MIARISGEGQWHVTADLVQALNALDNRIVAAIEAGDEPTYRELLAELCNAVRERGEACADDHLAASNIIIPPPDLSLDDARALFTGDGIIPDTQLHLGDDPPPVV